MFRRDVFKPSANENSTEEEGKAEPEKIKLETRYIDLCSCCFIYNDFILMKRGRNKVAHCSRERSRPPGSNIAANVIC